MYLSKIELRNLRCFEHLDIELDAKLNLIEGLNGSGKTTIVEALYYLCYLRSFRTNITQEMISFDSDSFFIKALLVNKSSGLMQDQSDITMQVGFAPRKRLVKLNNQEVTSFKQLISNYRVIVLTEDDLDIIKAGPEIRRNFIDQYIYLQNPAWLTELHSYKRILDQRNSLLKNLVFDLENYHFWTKQLTLRSQAIQKVRQDALKELQHELNCILINNFKEEFSDFVVEFAYQVREWQPSTQGREQFMQRTLFGAHLDDYQIKLSAKSSRKFASRGQQKLIAILMKVAQIITLKRLFNGAILFLLDDFVTDLDHTKIAVLIELLNSLQVQLVFTAPNLTGQHKNILVGHEAKIITI